MRLDKLASYIKILTYLQEEMSTVEEIVFKDVFCETIDPDILTHFKSFPQRIVIDNISEKPTLSLKHGTLLCYDGSLLSRINFWNFTISMGRNPIITKFKGTNKILVHSFLQFSGTYSKHEDWEFTDEEILDQKDSVTEDEINLECRGDNVVYMAVVDLDNIKSIDLTDLEIFKRMDEEEMQPMWSKHVFRNFIKHQIPLKNDTPVNLLLKNSLATLRLDRLFSYLTENQAGKLKIIHLHCFYFITPETLPSLTDLLEAFPSIQSIELRMYQSEVIYGFLQFLKRRVILSQCSITYEGDPDDGVILAWKLFAVKYFSRRMKVVFKFDDYKFEVM